MVDAEQVHHRSMQIIPADWINRRFPANFIGLTKGEAGLQPPTGEPAAEAISIMVAARSNLIRCRLGKWGTTEFCREHDQRILEHATLFEIRQ